MNYPFKNCTERTVKLPQPVKTGADLRFLVLLSYGPFEFLLELRLYFCFFLLIIFHLHVLLIVVLGWVKTLRPGCLMHFAISCVTTRGD